MAFNERGKAVSVLTMNTLAFTVCFAVWVLNGVLVTFLVDAKTFAFDQVQVGWLMGLPVLTGSVLRLPIGMLTDRFGGRVVFPAVMLVAAAATLSLSFAHDYAGFLLGSLGFGLAGTGFAVGIAYTSTWFGRQRQGTALGIFGAGNAGSAITSIAAPMLLRALTAGGASPEGWRWLPRGYAAALVVTTVAFLCFTYARPLARRPQSWRAQLAPLKVLRVWRFGLYYFLVFGAFVALAQWLIPYFMNVYGTSLATAGLLAAVFSFPSGVIRALGGWISDRFGARRTLAWVLGTCAVGCAVLCVPRMEIDSPGEGVTAARGGVVTRVTSSEIVVGPLTYPLTAARATTTDTGATAGAAVATGDSHAGRYLPRITTWHQASVVAGQTVKRKQLLARGFTHISFAGDIWVFTALVFVVGVAMGIGKAAVYKYIPDYFPEHVGVVGGMVGVIGGLGGFVCPIVFGYFLRATGLWTSCWAFLLVLAVISLAWFYVVVSRLERQRDSYAEGIDPAIAVLPMAPPVERPLPVASAASGTQ